MRHKKTLIRAWFTNISQLQNDFTILWGFYFYETSQFRENKTLAKISESTVFIYPKFLKLVELIALVCLSVIPTFS